MTLAVRASVEDTDDDRLELLRNVEAITGTAANQLSDEKKQDERNPWIAEGMWHLCLFLSSRNQAFHSTGTVIALDRPHIGAKDHGFDVVALYETAQADFGVSLVECKAYEKDPGKAINVAVEFFRAFDGGKHDARIRQVVSYFRELLHAQKQQRISPSLWKTARLYLPNPHYDAASAVDWLTKRPSFKSLKFPVIVMPHAVPSFRTYFDRVAMAMLAFGGTLKNV